MTSTGQWRQLTTKSGYLSYALIRRAQFAKRLDIVSQISDKYAFQSTVQLVVGAALQQFGFNY
jgi:hypothetical protein